MTCNRAIVLSIQICSALTGWIGFILRWILRIWNMLPLNVAQMLFGLALCYFGGTFTTTIAAAGLRDRAVRASVGGRSRAATPTSPNRRNPTKPIQRQKISARLAARLPGITRP